MKRLILATSLVFVVSVPAAMAKPPTRAHVQTYLSKYYQVRVQFGKRAPGCKLVGRNATCHRSATDALVVKSIHVLERFLTPPVVQHQTISVGCWDVNTCAPNSPTLHQTVPVTPSFTGSSDVSSGNYANVPGVPSSFASCVAMRESTDGAGSSNIYGIQGLGGLGSLTEQKQAFAQMYAARGTEPWAPYDGC